MKRYDAVVIGAGFAGAATAWWLKREGAEVLILEQEEVPGTHASGRNAGIVRQAAEDTPTTLLCARGAAFIGAPPAGFHDQPLLAPTGGYLLASGADVPHLAEFQKRLWSAGVESQIGSRASALEHCPLLDSATFDQTLFTPSDGAADIHALLAGYLHGIEVRTGEPVLGFEGVGRKIQTVRTAKGAYAADWVVLAAGAWSGELAREAGALGFELQPRRRHLVYTKPREGQSSPSPYLWFLGPPFYVRPETGGWLMSPCDEELFAPCAPPSHPEAELWMAERLKGALPSLSKTLVAKVWAQLRTFAPDDRFVVGPDPRLTNLCWVAGLGGHGMTSSAAVGELAAARMARTLPAVDPVPFDPKRFA